MGRFLDLCPGDAVYGDHCGERGFTLVETLVVCVILVVALTATLSLLDKSSRVAINDQERSTALSEDIAGFSRMTREIRQAYKINGPLMPVSGSNWVDILVRRTPPGSSTAVAQRVLYRCDAATQVAGQQACRRYTSAAGDTRPAGTAPAGDVGRVVIPRLLNGTTAAPVFTSFASPNGPAGRPAFVEATVRAPAGGERTTGYAHQILLNDSMYLRNLDMAR